MDQLSSRLKQITSELKDYLETRIDLLVLNTTEQISQWIGLSVQRIVGFTLLGTGLFFCMIAAAIFLGELLGKAYLGYLIVSIPILLIGLIFVLAKPFGIASSIQKQMMKGILESTAEEEEAMNLKLPEHKENVLQEGDK